MKVKRIGNHNLPVPKRESEHAAGYDLRAAETVTILPGQQVLIKTGFAWQIKEGKFGIIKDRSSMAYKRRLITHAGVIDSDYRGEVHVLLSNESLSDWATIEKGDRIAQMIITTHDTEPVHEFTELNETGRGVGGFGSTGQ